MDKKEFVILVAMLEEAFGIEISKERGKIYFEFLKEFSKDQIRSAFERAILELKYFPKISEIRSFIQRPMDEEQEYIHHLEKATSEFIQGQIEYKKDSEKNEQVAKENLAKIKEMLKESLGPTLEGERAEKFEEKRKLAKEKFKLVQGAKK